MTKKKKYENGTVYGNLTLIKEVEPIFKGGMYRRHAEFICTCGNKSIKIMQAVTGGRTKSCGSCSLSYVIPYCKGKNNGSYKHGMFGTRFYHIYHSIMDRCKDKNNRWYGGKNIKNNWKSFLDFKTDMYDSYLEHIKHFGEKETTIDRIDNRKGYSKTNCKWSTYVEQATNRSNNKRYSFDGRIQTQSQWIREMKINKWYFNKDKRFKEVV
jgi:hypothetical protein